MAKEEMNEELEEFEPKSGSESDDFVTKYGKMIISGILLIVIVIGAFYYFNWQAEEDSNKAMLALSRITPYLEQGDYKTALEGDKNKMINGVAIIGLKEIANKYSNTTTGELAAMYAGNAYLVSNDYKNAKPMFEKGLSSDSEIVLFGSLSGYAACLENDGNYKEAASQYEKASATVQAEGLDLKFKYLAGLCYEKANEKDKAIEYYTMVVRENSFSEFGNLSKAGLTRLGTIIE